MNEEFRVCAIDTEGAIPIDCEGYCLAVLTHTFKALEALLDDDQSPVVEVRLQQWSDTEGYIDLAVAPRTEEQAA